MSTEVVLAFHGFLLSQSEARWRTIGLDLDGVTTSPPELVGSCVPNPSAPGAAEDGDDGRDNQFGTNLLPALLIMPEWVDEVTDSEARGLGALVVRLREYNGRRNDPHVSVALMYGVLGTPGLPGMLPPEIAVPPDGLSVFAPDAPPPPRWDGGDFFWVDERDFFDGDGERPRWADPDGYVADGVLVARLPTLPLRLPDRESETTSPMTEVFFLTALPEDPSAAVTGTLAGRLPVAETAAGLAACDRFSSVGELERLLDLLADIHATPGQHAETRCDAISVGIRASGQIAGWGGVASRVALECP